MKGNKVLVTGGLGFIGSYTVRALVEQGYDVAVFDRATDTRTLRQVNVGEDVEVFSGDITEPTTFFRAVRQSGASHIIHLVSLLSDTTHDDPRAAIQVNIEGTNTVFEAARMFDDQIERVVWSSSSAIYAPPERYEGPVTEEDLVYPGSVYGATKGYNEHQARVYQEEFEVSIIGLRPTVAYGPYRESGTSAFLTDLIEKPALGEPVTVDYGDQLLNWQYVKDMADAFIAACFASEDALSRRIYNVSGDAATVREVTELIRGLIPESEITVSDSGELPWMQLIDDSAARQDFGYSPDYDLESGIKEYVNVVRSDHGCPPLWVDDH